MADKLKIGVLISGKDIELFKTLLNGIFAFAKNVNADLILFFNEWDLNKKLPFTSNQKNLFSIALNSEMDGIIIVKNDIHALQIDNIKQMFTERNIPVVVCDLFNKIKCEPDQFYCLTEHLAKRLLAKTDLSINEISVKCGYDTPSYFMKQFKKETGITALQYRKSHTKK